MPSTSARVGPTRAGPTQPLTPIRRFYLETRSPSPLASNIAIPPNTSPLVPETVHVASGLFGFRKAANTNNGPTVPGVLIFVRLTNPSSVVHSFSSVTVKTVQVALQPGGFVPSLFEALLIVPLITPSVSFNSEFHGRLTGSAFFTSFSQFLPFSHFMFSIAVVLDRAPGPTDPTSVPEHLISTVPTMGTPLVSSTSDPWDATASVPLSSAHSNLPPDSALMH